VLCRCIAYSRVLAYRVLCDPLFDEEESCLGAQMALSTILKQKSEISALNLAQVGKQEVQSIEEEDLTALRSSLASLCSYQMMAGVLASETEEREVTRAVSSITPCVKG